MPPEYDPAAYAAQWAGLGGWIKAALPLAPGGDAAQAFLDEWQALLAPLEAVATLAMKAGVNAMYQRMDEWQHEADPGFDATVFGFIQRAMVALKAAAV